MLVGPARPSVEGGGFRTFPFSKLARLSDAPSTATNARAGKPSTPNPTPYTLRPTSYTPHPSPYTLHLQTSTLRKHNPSLHPNPWNRGDTAAAGPERGQGGGGAGAFSQAGGGRGCSTTPPYDACLISASLPGLVTVPVQPLSESANSCAGPLQVLRNQGVQASEWGEGVVAECGTRVLKTVSPALPTLSGLSRPPKASRPSPPLSHRPLAQVLQEMRRLRSDPKYFEQGQPMGSEVLAWLQVTPRVPTECRESVERVPREHRECVGRVPRKCRECVERVPRESAGGRG